MAPIWTSVTPTNRIEPKKATWNALLYGFTVWVVLRDGASAKGPSAAML